MLLVSLLACCILHKSDTTHLSKRIMTRKALSLTWLVDSTAFPVLVKCIHVKAVVNSSKVSSLTAQLQLELMLPLAGPVFYGKRPAVTKQNHKVWALSKKTLRGREVVKRVAANLPKVLSFFLFVVVVACPGCARELFLQNGSHLLFLQPQRQGPAAPAPIAPPSSKLPRVRYIHWPLRRAGCSSAQPLCDIIECFNNYE